MEIEVILGANESFLLSRLDSPSVWLWENFPWVRKKGNLSQVLNIVTINEYWRITDTHRELYLWNAITHIHSFMERWCIFKSIPWTYRFFLKLHCLIKIALSTRSLHSPSNTKRAAATTAKGSPSQREPAWSRIGLAVWMGFQQEAKDGANSLCSDIKHPPPPPVTIHSMRTWASGSLRIQMGRRPILCEAALISWMPDLCGYVGHWSRKDPTLSFLLCCHCLETH